MNMHPPYVRLVVACVAAGFLLSLGAGCSREARITRRLQAADKYFAAGEYDKAEIEYKNVLQLNDRAPQALSRLGVICLEQGRIGRANFLLREALKIRPDDLETRVKLGTIDVRIGRIAEARDAANYVLERQPENPDAPFLLADASLEPKDIVAADERLKSLPRPAANKPTVLIARGVLQLKQQKLQEAEDLLLQARQIDPKLPAANAALANLYLMQRQVDRAAQALASAAEAAPIRSSIRLQYARFNIQTGHPDLARKTLEEIRAKAPDMLNASMLLADLALTEKKYAESATLLEGVLSRDPSVPEAAMLLARVRLALGENEKALSALEAAQKFYPRSPELEYYLGLTQTALRDVPAAIDSFNQAVSLAPDFSAAILALAELNIRQGNAAAAANSLRALVQKHPEISQAQFLLAAAYRQQRNLDAALAIYRQLGTSFPKNPESFVQAGQVLLQQNKPADARQAFDKALEITPGYPAALEQLVNLDIIAKRFAPARQRLEAQIAQSGSSATLQTLLARVHFAEGDTAQAEAALRKVIELQPDAADAYLSLAQLYLSTHQPQKALSDLEAAVAKNPKDIRPLTIMGVLQSEQKDHEGARASYEKILAIDPKAVVALNNLAYLYSEQFGNPSKALEMAQRARDAAPNSPEIADTLGWILHKAGRYSQALALLDESAGKLPANPEVQFHLGMNYYMLGNDASARATLEQALKLSDSFSGAADAKNALGVLSLDLSNATAARTALEQTLAVRKDDPMALIRLATVQERSGEPEKSLASYRAVLKTNPGNVAAALGAVRLLRAENDAAGAIAVATAARKATPNNADIAQALGQLSLETRDYSRAFGFFQEARLIRPDDPELLFEFAQSAYLAGQVPLAQSSIQDALRATSGFSHADAARKFLEFIALSSDPAAAAAASARISEALKADPAFLPAMMASAAAAEQRRNVDQAMRTYADVMAKYPDFSPAKRQATILNSRQPTIDANAADLAEKARLAFPNDAELAKAVGIIAHRQGSHARAVALLQDSARTRTEDAEIQYYLGKSQLELKQPAGKRSLERAVELGLSGELAADARRLIANAK
jgi:tetratricopeptide (TPR) repeat protein